MYQLVIKRELLKSQRAGVGVKSRMTVWKVRKCEIVKEYESVNKLNAPTK